MTAVLRQLDSELAMSGGPYILGASLSFVDLLFVPFLELWLRPCLTLKGLNRGRLAFQRF